MNIDKQEFMKVIKDLTIDKDSQFAGEKKFMDFIGTDEGFNMFIAPLLDILKDDIKDK